MQVPEFSSVDELLDALQATQEETLPLFDLSPDQLTKVYAPGKWNVRQLLHHITDAETVMYMRLRRVISEENPIIWGFDQDAWTSKLQYQNRSLNINKAIYNATRYAIIDLTNRYYVMFKGKTFIHSETGLRTLGQEFEKVAWHNANHLMQIKQAISQSS